MAEIRCARAIDATTPIMAMTQKTFQRPPAAVFCAGGASDSVGFWGCVAASRDCALSNDAPDAPGVSSLGSLTFSDIESPKSCLVMDALPTGLVVQKNPHRRSGVRVG